MVRYHRKKMGINILSNTFNTLNIYSWLKYTYLP
nr:MAG TPA: hypothetical protein [Bacteriophage sp.]